MYNKRRIGADYESIAINYLSDHDYDIVERNFFSIAGEIDIIAKNEGYLVFVEVKYRKTTAHGFPAEAISFAKQRRIIKAAKLYMLKKSISHDTPVRFDVISILDEEISVLKGAFEL